MVEIYYTVFFIYWAGRLLCEAALIYFGLFCCEISSGMETKIDQTDHGISRRIESSRND